MLETSKKYGGFLQYKTIPKTYKRLAYSIKIMIPGFGKCPEPKICISMAACWLAGCVCAAWVGWVGWLGEMVGRAGCS